MMICPLCGSAAHTRSSFQVSSMTKERYNQRQNINCRHTFVTHETFVRSISTPKEVHPVQLHPTNSCLAVQAL
ncbi:ogr/Delta-like zinc finger family protein [Klebsiella quasipneumoniae subsp. similipneumoniae]|uniref:Ogr/Delta-like zinc finger family protein n=1 Tax=Klebsiella quasipneumoniae subsp. similipneumoniae TaxID=1463164 RepID=A0AAE4MK68_9ENTR|nr:ogr/Delta-like zinc finger family protein [Klebsiella quasipneumoniae]MDV0609070.1 ogr/Delta-like zinc finger family protein [Klebsiella quasipneumoniae subsp. similipneumoniae]MDV0637874.1 ogr/Delta-like zinc finger family protein [Klebsiella quasipneumoniae subsp. similipneumoniae]MDV0724340.1 ogr/Delta-like zinc finger family protein [Klebsiella quasipneumoniae subsp. similipneumoniae]MDV0735365.1 ogr/Delta-like zinc finger family protein [Klebsiella quasipneumoniae subsp. similipneumonia